ncbi:MAG: hypothetical protein H6740_22180, partial [Alphaproteobacteria bacterium]|nr:hypothetical protein [Alphaproteobacteria bacterium]
FHREPDFFAASELEGPEHDTVVARAPDGQVVGLCGRSARPAWVDGRVQRLGYLSSLRVNQAWRGRIRVLKGGFAAVQALHEAAPTPYSFTTIIEDNAPARRVLTRGLPGFPRYLERGVLVTLALPTWRRRRPPRHRLALRQATEADLVGITEILSAQDRGFDLRPVWTPEDLVSERRTPGLSPEDFTLAFEGERLVGCVALWDQQAVKQSVVTDYEGGLGTFRGLVNLGAPWVGVPRLPEPGQRFSHAYLSHLALASEEVALPLLTEAYNRSVGRGYAYLTLGMPEQHPLTPTLKKRFGALEYRSLIYLVSWADGHAAAEGLSGRLLWPEVAVL